MNNHCINCKHCISPSREKEQAAKSINELIEELTDSEACHRLQHVMHNLLMHVCTLNPEWEEVFENHFCGQFKLKDGVH